MTDTPQLVWWPHLDRELERWKRKYPHIEEDLRAALASSNTRRDAIAGYGHQLWKARIASRDMQRGARGGFRLYYWVELGTPPARPTYYPVTMYPKTERADITVDEMRALLKRFFEWAPHLSPSSRKR